MGNVYLRQILSAIIVFIFCLQTYAQSLPTLNLGASDSNFSLSNSLKPDAEFTDSEKLILEKLFNQPMRATLDLMFLLTALTQKAAKLESQIGEEALLKRILIGKESDEVKIEVPGIGKAEYNKLGDSKRGRVFIRVIHYGSGIVFNFYDKDVFNRTYLNEKLEAGANLPPEEKETRRYLREQFNLYQARQIMHTPNNFEQYDSLDTQAEQSEMEIEELTQKLINDAIEKPPTKNYDKLKGYEARGRDVVNIFHTSSQVDFVEKLDRATQLKGFNRIKTYWQSIREKPILPQDYDLALVSTVLQSGATLGVGLSLFLATGTFDAIPTCLSVIWAGIVGINIRTYQNWTILSKSKMTQYLKGILLSLSFNYTFIFISEGIKAMNKLATIPTTPSEYIGLFLVSGFAALSLLSAEGLKNHFHSATNTIINNWAKNKIAEIPRERTRANMNQNEVKILGRTVNQGYLEAQAASGGGSVIKLLDLVDAGGKIETPVGGFSWGRIFLIISGFAAAYFNVLYTEKHDLKGRRVHRQLWEGYKFKITFGTTDSQYTVNIPIVGIIFNPLSKLTNGGFKLVSSFMEVLSKQIAETTAVIFETSFYTPPNKDSPASSAISCSSLFK